MHVYDAVEDGPTMRLELPVSVVETLLDVAYRHITPAMGLDGAFVDEIRGQLNEARDNLELADRFANKAETRRRADDEIADLL